MSKVNGNKVLKAGLGYTIGNYMLKGLTFLTIPIFSRIMSTEDYGIYNTFVAYEAILFVLIGFAIHTSYKNAWYKFGVETNHTNVGNDYNTYRSCTMILLLLSFAVWFIVGNICGDKISEILGLDVLSLNLLLIYSFSMAVMQCYNSDIALRYQFQDFLKVSGINAVSNIVLSIILMLTIFSGKRYVGRVIGTTLPILFIAVYIIVIFLRQAKPQKIKAHLSWGIKYSLPIVPHGISQVILSQFDRIMINKMIGAATAGVYSFAYNIYTIVMVTTQSLDGVWCPWFYEQMNSKNYTEIRKKSNIYIIGMFLFFAIVLLVSPEMVKILGDKDYWDAAYCVIPIIAGAFFSFLYTLPSAVEYYYEKTKYIAIGTTGAAIINVVLNYMCINQYGYIAAAYTTLFTYFIYFVFHFILAWKINKSCLFSLKAIVSCGIGIVLLNLYAVCFIDNIIFRWILALIFAVVFFMYLVYKLEIIDKFKKRGDR